VGLIAALVSLTSAFHPAGVRGNPFRERAPHGCPPESDQLEWAGNTPTLGRDSQMETELSDTQQPQSPGSGGNGGMSDFETRTEARLTNIERDLRAESGEAKKTRQAFGMFALLAVVIALANLVAVGFKLDKKDSTAAKSAGPAAAPAVAKTAGPLAHQSVATLKEYSIAPEPSQVAAGSVTFKVRNAGSINHEFVVLRTNKKASQLLKGNEADESGNVGEIGNLDPGQTKSLKLDLKAGHYALICNLTGHYKLGQHADLTVR
jgi:uncharacterized cupredoxin-like copper-binding protein